MQIGPVGVGGYLSSLYEKSVDTGGKDAFATDHLPVNLTRLSKERNPQIYVIESTSLALRHHHFRIIRTPFKTPYGKDENYTTTAGSIAPNTWSFTHDASCTYPASPG